MGLILFIHRVLGLVGECCCEKIFLQYESQFLRKSTLLLLKSLTFCHSLPFTVSELDILSSLSLSLIARLNGRAVVVDLLLIQAYSSYSNIFSIIKQYIHFFSSLAYTELNRWCFHNHSLREMLEGAFGNFLFVLLADTGVIHGCYTDT